MKTTLLLISFLALAAIGWAGKVSETEGQFEKEINEKISDPAEEKAAAAQLAKAEEEINAENAKFDSGKASYKEALNKWSNVPKDEFEKEREGASDPSKSMMTEEGRGLGALMPPEEEQFNPEYEAFLEDFFNRVADRAAPASIDNRNSIVTPVKNQRSCGSCSAFAATATHESCMIKAGASKSKIDLSEQYLVDCGYGKPGMNGCKGAWFHKYSELLVSLNGQGPHETSYPYLNTSPKLKCPTGSGAKTFNGGAKVSKSVSTFSCTEDKMKQLLADFGTVATCIYASDRSFGNYRGGVFNGCSSKGCNHAVTAVGYGTEGGKDYWIVKNSWGSNWGDRGYIKIARGSRMCGIGGICAVAQCVKTSGSVSAVPSPPPPSPVPAVQECDLNSYYPGLTGNWVLYIKSRVDVTCDKGICRPRYPGPSNGCMYICGKVKCQR